jgi:phage gp36-like protein/phage gp37-like protein
MAYRTQTDLEEQISQTELVELTDDAGSGAVDTSALNRAIADADAEIDSYCGGRYAMPFSPVPVIIRKFSVDMAIYNLFARRSVLKIPEDRQKRYDNAVRFFRDLAKGLISLARTPRRSRPPASPRRPGRKKTGCFPWARRPTAASGHWTATDMYTIEQIEDAVITKLAPLKTGYTAKEGDPAVYGTVREIRTYQGELDDEESLARAARLFPTILVMYGGSDYEEHGPRKIEKAVFCLFVCDKSLRSEAEGRRGGTQNPGAYALLNGIRDLLYDSRLSKDIFP